MSQSVYFSSFLKVLPTIRGNIAAGKEADIPGHVLILPLQESQREAALKIMNIIKDKAEHIGKSDTGAWIGCVTHAC